MTLATTGNFAVVAWKDNKVVTLASNAYAMHPISNVNRVAKIEAKRRKITVACPKVVAIYNSYMGRVDLFDQNVHAQRVSFQRKKWWFPLFAFGIDAECQSSCNLYKDLTKQKITYCEF